MIIDVFRPLFEVTRDPSSHPKLHVFLQRVVGFDTVDDESKTERRYHKKFPYPKQWDYPQSPPYSYWFVVNTSIPVMSPTGFQDVLYVCQHGKPQ
jgi:AMP deaminase